MSTPVFDIQLLPCLAWYDSGTPQNPVQVRSHLFFLRSYHLCFFFTFTLPRPRHDNNPPPRCYIFCTYSVPTIRRYRVRFLSDYFDRAGLGGVPANQLGMIEQVVISHGRTFTGTFYSSFSAHVFRHRLYLGKVGRSVGCSHHRSGSLSVGVESGNQPGACGHR